jgi:glutamine transport system substrate-binding protein
MMNQRKGGFLLHFKLFFIGLTILILSSCGTNDTLKVGVEKGFKPFAYVEEGQVKGFDVDLWKAIAKEAGYDYTWIPMGQGEMLKAVEKEKIDVALAGITIKGDRKKVLEFATPYYDTGLVMLTLANNEDINQVKDLKDKVIATKIGSSGYAYAQKVKDIKEIKAFPDIALAYKELLNQGADVVIFDKANAEQFMSTDGQGKVKTVGQTLTNEQYGIAVKKGSRHAGRINNALREMSDNGTYETIYMKWFGKKPKSLPGTS